MRNICYFLLILSFISSFINLKEGRKFGLAESASLDQVSELEAVSDGKSNLKETLLDEEANSDIVKRSKRSETNPIQDEKKKINKNINKNEKNKGNWGKKRSTTAVPSTASENQVASPSSLAQKKIEPGPKVRVRSFFENGRRTRRNIWILEDGQEKPINENELPDHLGTANLNQYEKETMERFKDNPYFLLDNVFEDGEPTKKSAEVVTVMVESAYDRGQLRSRKISLVAGKDKEEINESDLPSFLTSYFLNKHEMLKITNFMDDNDVHVDTTYLGSTILSSSVMVP